MNRDWKPGDVVKLPTGVRAIADGDGNLIFGRRKYDNARAGSINAIHARPLVVIDPEDAEQVERLLASYLSAYVGCDTSPQPGELQCMRAALREFADPTPHIEEPTGLGAVVEDADGMRWLRGHGDPGFYVWRDRSDVIGRRFSDLKNVVRVLSDGAPS